MSNTSSALETLNLSLDRDMVMQQRLNQSTIGTVSSLNTSIINQGVAA